MDNPFIGRGWGFPPVFDQASGSVSMAEDEKDIEESLGILLATRVGERIMQPAYGCNLEEMVFEAMNLTMKTRLADLIENAILYFEPRIDLEEVDVDTSSEADGILMILIRYRVRNTNSRYNYVYPFYKSEGSQIHLNR